MGCGAGLVGEQPKGSKVVFIGVVVRMRERRTQALAEAVKELNWRTTAPGGLGNEIGLRLKSATRMLPP